MIWDGEIYCPNTDVCAHWTGTYTGRLEIDVPDDLWSELWPEP